MEHGVSEKRMTSSIVGPGNGAERRARLTGFNGQGYHGGGKRAVRAEVFCFDWTISFLSPFFFSL
jgi:hypothetical protein